MIEWKKLPRSIRYEHDGMAADVWQVSPGRWAWTLYDSLKHCYIDSWRGIPETSEDDACNVVLAIMGS